MTLVHALTKRLPLLAAILLSACKDDLAAPANCPALCPGSFQVVDTVLLPS